jgi:hypothetical protein
MDSTTTRQPTLCGQSGPGVGKPSFGGINCKPTWAD